MRKLEPSKFGVRSLSLRRQRESVPFRRILQPNGLAAFEPADMPVAALSAKEPTGYAKAGVG